MTGEKHVHVPYVQNARKRTQIEFEVNLTLYQCNMWSYLLTIVKVGWLIRPDIMFTVQYLHQDDILYTIPVPHNHIFGAEIL